MDCQYLEWKKKKKKTMEHTLEFCSAKYWLTLKQNYKEELNYKGTSLETIEEEYVMETF